MSAIQFGYSHNRVDVAQLDQHATWRHVHPEFKRRFLAFTAASGYRIGVGTAWRSAASQDAERARRLQLHTGARMAPSSGSWHCSDPAGAIDVVFDDAAAQRWAHEHAQGFGLWFPAADEPWHLQALGYPYGRHGNPVPALRSIELPGAHPDPGPVEHHPEGSHPVLHRGSVGPHVTLVQTILKTKASQNITVDGHFGHQTEEAVLHLQTFLNLPQTGVIRDREWDILEHLARS